MSWRKVLAITIVPMLASLAGCGTTPTSAPTESKPAPETRTAPAPTPSGSSTKSGGYYLDDGPGDDAPDNLTSIPDAEPRAEKLHPWANRPYAVMGTRYEPLQAAAGYKKRGIASWYGKRFHNKKTSSGEAYDMYAMTAAHTTLPIPSYARVTNLSNGKSVVVRINDRGPFLHNRIIDLSYAAALKLDYIKKGSAMVEVEAVEPGAAAPVQAASADEGARVPPTTLSADSIHYVQLGAFNSQANAEGLRDRARSQLGGQIDRAIEVISQQGLFRVRLGPYASREEAANIAEQVGQSLNLNPRVVR